ncbi:MAG: hypothetical protein J2P36_23515 [Ktedonobacteraceae bacterium]|nr:hypothetical protein [Ktedonobacteraceae bacterium]
MLQVNTTNPLEGWHSTIKYQHKSHLTTWSLKNSAAHILERAREFDTRAEKAAIEFRTRSSPACIEHPWLKRFPYPVQALIEQQIQQGKELYDGDDEWDFHLIHNTACACSFYRKYSLPCAHIWCQHLTLNTLRDADFLQWSTGWEDSGFEIYHDRVCEYYAKGGDDEDAQDQRPRLEMREVLELIKSKHFELEEEASKMDVQQREQFINWWLRKLHTSTSGLFKACLEEFHNDSGLQKPEIKQAEPWEGTSTAPISSYCLNIVD